MKKLLQKLRFIFRARLLGSKVHFRAQLKNTNNIHIGKKVKVLAMAAIDGLRGSGGVALGDGVTLNPYVQISGRVDIGEGSEINNFTFVAGGGEGIQIGEDVLIGPHVTIVAANHAYLDPIIPIKHQGDVARRIVIEDGVWIGASAVVLPGVRLGRGAIVGAGAVVTKSFPAGAILMGVPARLHSFRPGFSHLEKTKG